MFHMETLSPDFPASPGAEQVMNKNNQSDFARPRIVLVDTLRGYALMGLFLVHMVEYYELYWYKPEPGLINTVMFGLFGGKAYAMFAMLFGISFFIIMDNQARKGVDFRLRFLWRLLLLLAMGYIHGLIYGGDILQILAITGVVLVPLYRFGNKALLISALVFILQLPSAVIYILANTLPGFEYAQPAHWTLHPSVFEVYANGNFIDVLKTNMWQGQAAKWMFMIESGRLWNIIGLSILGFLLGRISFFTDIDRYRRAYLFTISVSVVVALLLITFRQDMLSLVSTGKADWIFSNIYTAWTNHAWIAVSVMGLVLLYQLPGIGRVLALLAPCGRVTLTLYVTQSFVFVPFFYGFGANAFAYIGQTVSLILGLVLWCVQVWLAHIWMRHFHYGPLEWAWRSATWLRTDVPFKRINPQAA